MDKAKYKKMYELANKLSQVDAASLNEQQLAERDAMIQHLQKIAQGMAEGLDPIKKKRLNALIDLYREANDPNEYANDQAVYKDDVIARIRLEFGDKIADRVEKSATEGVAEAGMPSSVIKSKQRYSQMTPAEFAQAHKDKSDEELISMAWRHGYGKGSKHYVDKRNKGKQGVAEGSNRDMSDMEHHQKNVERFRKDLGLPDRDKPKGNKETDMDHHRKNSDRFRKDLGLDKKKGVEEGSSYQTDSMVSHISQIITDIYPQGGDKNTYMKLVAREMPRIVKNNPKLFRRAFGIAYDRFFHIDQDDDDDSFDYTDYSMRQGELGNPDRSMREGSLNEFAPAGSGGGNIPRGPRGRDPWGGNDGPGDDPYKYPKPEHYRRSIDYFEKFEANHFDKEEFDEKTGVFKGYWFDRDAPNGLIQIGYFKFSNPAKNGDNDPGMGWYYEPDIDEGVAEGRYTPPKNTYYITQTSINSDEGRSVDVFDLMYNGKIIKRYNLVASADRQLRRLRAAGKPVQMDEQGVAEGYPSPHDYDSDIDYYNAVDRYLGKKGPRPGDEDYELYAPGDDFGDEDDEQTNEADAPRPTYNVMKLGGALDIDPRMLRVAITRGLQGQATRTDMSVLARSFLNMISNSDDKDIQYIANLIKTGNPKPVAQESTAAIAERNAFVNAMRNVKQGEKFSVGGKEYTKTTRHGEDKEVTENIDKEAYDRLKRVFDFSNFKGDV